MDSGIASEVRASSANQYLGPEQTLQIGHIKAYTPEPFMLTLTTSGLHVLDIDLFEHSFEVHAFLRSRARALLSHHVRSTLLSLNKRLASRLFAYHCGALCN